jgi:DNA helicase-2/ATP-dependent DNA helicase PcrA
MTPTTQQQHFLTQLVTTSANLALVARAGCGKTSTILLAVDAVTRRWPAAETLVCAFNKAIADEVGEKLKKAGHTNWRTVSASTLHSLGFGLLKFLFKPTVDDKKVRKLVEQRNDDISQAYAQQITALVGYAKGEGFGFFTDRAIGDVAAWHQIADHYDVNGLEDTSEADAVVEAAQAVYRASLAQTDVIDYDDMILMPLVKNLRVKFGKDFIFLDEAQDLSRSKQALARKFLKPHTGRMIVVGDDRQAIYGFSGADSAALNNLISSLQATECPLSVTWRCPKAVVAVAQQYVPDIQAAPGAPEGQVTYLNELPDDVGPEDAILCRNTAPLIEIAYKMIRAGKPVKVEGRNIGDGLIALAQRWKVASIDALLNRLEVYRDREIQKAMARGNEAKVEEIEDRVGTLMEVCKSCLQQNKTTVQDVVTFINNLFADGDEASTILATYHRSKGREWGPVFLWEHSTRCPSRAARQDWQLAQEENLAYVAITRAQRELVWVG